MRQLTLSALARLSRNHCERASVKCTAPHLSSLKRIRNFHTSGVPEIITWTAIACVTFILGERVTTQKATALARQSPIIAKEAQSHNQQKTKQRHLYCLVAGSLCRLVGSYRPDYLEQQSSLDILKRYLNTRWSMCELCSRDLIASIEEREREDQQWLFKKISTQALLITLHLKRWNRRTAS